MSKVWKVTIGAERLHQVGANSWAGRPRYPNDPPEIEVTFTVEAETYDDAIKQSEILLEEHCKGKIAVISRKAEFFPYGL